eukprot:PITA_20599
MAALYTCFKLFVFVIFLLVILVFNASDGVSVEAKLCDKYCDIQKFDELMKVLMSYGNIPGAQLAVAKGGEVKYFKAFGVANRDTGELLTTHHIMRYNSISKFITGVAILQLIQEGRLSLEDKPFRFLENLDPPRGATVDQRLFNVTVQQMLQHTGGWNKTFSNVNVAILPTALYVSQSLGHPAPPSVYDCIRYMKPIPLDFDPGSAMEYADIGYLVLGRVIEKVSGTSYADYMRQHIFKPLGLTKMKLAQSQVEHLAENEVHYYGFDGDQDLTVLSIFPGEGFVNATYGIINYRSLESAAGWVGNAGDIVRFIDHVDGLREPAILNKDMVYAMLNAPMPSNRSLAGNPLFGHSQGLNVFVSVDKKGKITSFQHGGAIYGAMSYVTRLVDNNISFAFLFNTLPLGNFVYEAIGNLTQVANSIHAWPPGDLFEGEK